jgi:hypothetical protein
MLILLFLLPLLGLAEVSVSGLLQEKGTRKRLSEVNVFLLPHKLKAVTAADGSFRFDSVPPGPCQVIVNLTGFNKLESAQDCSSNRELTLYLERRSYTGFETTVTGKVQKRDDQAQSLTQAEFLKAPGSFGGDPVRAAQNLPGVAQNGASAQIVVQGASPDDTNYVINGHRVPLVFHFGGLSSVITPEAVDRVDLLPAGYGPEYSLAMGGIIGLTTRDPRKDRLHGMAFVDLLNSGGLIEGPIDQKSSFLVSGRYSYIGQVLKAVAKENDNFELTAAPTYYDFTGIYVNELNERNKFRTTFVFSRDELELILNRAANNDTELRGNFESQTQFFRVIPQLTTQLDARTRMDHSIAIGKDEIFFDIGGRFLDVEANVISQRSELSREWSGRSKTFLGLDNYWSQSQVGVNLPNNFAVGGVNNPFSVGENRRFTEKATQTLFGAYVRQELKPTAESPWTFLPNLRFDHFTINRFTKLQPRFQLRYQWDPSLLLRGTWGQYVQPPEPPQVSRFYGNNRISSPYAWHYTAGFTKDFRQQGAQGLEFTNNYFYKDLRNLVVPDVSTNYSNAGTGRIYGGEVQTKYRQGPWAGQVVYTLLRSRREIPGFGEFPSEFDQTHNLNLIGSLDRERWTFSARFRFVTGNPFTPINGATFDSDNDVYIPIRGPLYSQRFDAFNQLDVRVDRKFIYDTWILTAYLDVQNLYNARNSQNINYSFDYRQKQKIRGLPVLPTIGLKGEF